ncbi:unnamed protein product [Ixodes persulcatus]
MAEFRYSHACRAMENTQQCHGRPYRRKHSLLLPVRVDQRCPGAVTAICFQPRGVAPFSPLSPSHGTPFHTATLPPLEHHASTKADTERKDGEAVSSIADTMKTLFMVFSSQDTFVSRSASHLIMCACVFV